MRLERTVSWSQTRRDTSFAIPGNIALSLYRKEARIASLIFQDGSFFLPAGEHCVPLLDKEWVKRYNNGIDKDDSAHGASYKEIEGKHDGTREKAGGGNYRP